MIVKPRNDLSATMPRRGPEDLLTGRHLSMFLSASGFTQHLNPLHSVFGSTLAALIPIVLLLVLLAVARMTAWLAVTVGAVITVIMAITIWHSPGGPTIGAWGIGAGTGIWVIDWITFWGVVIYNTLLETGAFADFRRWLVARATADVRVQTILLAWSLGALLEGIVGFGYPWAVIAPILVGLGVVELDALRVAAIANNAPVSYGALGAPILALAAVTGVPLLTLSASVGRIVAVLALLPPWILILLVSGWKGVRGAWPLAVVGSLSYILGQFPTSQWLGPYLPDIIGALVSFGALLLLLKFWQPQETLGYGGVPIAQVATGGAGVPPGAGVPGGGAAGTAPSTVGAGSGARGGPATDGAPAGGAATAEAARPGVRDGEHAGVRFLAGGHLVHPAGADSGLDRGRAVGEQHLDQRPVRRLPVLGRHPAAHAVAAAALAQFHWSRDRQAGGAADHECGCVHRKLRAPGGPGNPPQHGLDPGHPRLADPDRSLLLARLPLRHAPVSRTCRNGFGSDRGHLAKKWSPIQAQATRTPTRPVRVRMTREITSPSGGIGAGVLVASTCSSTPPSTTAT